jgi:hypothetical protein
LVSVLAPSRSSNYFTSTFADFLVKINKKDLSMVVDEELNDLSVEEIAEGVAIGSCPLADVDVSRAARELASIRRLVA